MELAQTCFILCGCR